MIAGLILRVMRPVTGSAGDVVSLALAVFVVLVLFGWFVLWAGAMAGRLLCLVDRHRWGLTNGNRSAFCRRRGCDAVRRCG